MSVHVDKCRSVCNSTVWRYGMRSCVCWARKCSLCQQQHDVNNSLLTLYNTRALRPYKHVGMKTLIKQGPASLPIK